MCATNYNTVPTLSLYYQQPSLHSLPIKMAALLAKDSTENPLENHPEQKIRDGRDGNAWTWSPDGWDLTHPTGQTSTLAENIVHLDCELVNIKIGPVKTALVIIDMQNIGLNKALDPPSALPMYEAQDAILHFAIPAARKLGLQIIWLNWGLTEDDLVTILPSEIRVFAFDVKTEKLDYAWETARAIQTTPTTF